MMTYRDIAPVKKTLTSKLSGTMEFEIFRAQYENGKPQKYFARAVKYGITVYEEFTPVEVGKL